MPGWLVERLGRIGLEALRARAAAAETELINLGITFTVYSDASAIDRILPFDCIPRVLTAAEWRRLERGVKQRVAALNAFLHDIYATAKILQDGVVPGRPGARQRQLPPGDEGFPGPLRHLCAYLRHRHRARRGRRVPGAGGQCAHALGRLLCGREPASDAAHAFPT